MERVFLARVPRIAWPENTRNTPQANAITSAPKAIFSRAGRPIATRMAKYTSAGASR